MNKVRKGRTNPKKYANDDWFIREKGEEGKTILQLRPTEQPEIKEMWTGSVNGMSKVGRFEIATNVWNYYSTAYFDNGVGLMPGSLHVWSDFLAEYINLISDIKDDESSGN
jgi:hypothetical protein